MLGRGLGRLSEHKASLQASYSYGSDVPKGLTRRHVMAPKAPEQAGRVLWAGTALDLLQTGLLIFRWGQGHHSVGPCRI